MLRASLSATLAIGLGLAAAAPAAARITPEEGWALLTDMARAGGATISDRQSRSGDTLTVDDVALRYVLPYGIGEVSVRLGPYTLTDRGDGTVALAQQGDMTVAFAARIGFAGEQLTASGAMILSRPGAETILSGTPEAMTATATAPVTRITMSGLDLTLPPGEDPGIDPGAIEFRFDGADTAATVLYERTAEGFRMTAESTAGPSSYALIVPVEFGGLAENTGGTAASSGTMSLALPRSGLSLLDLSDAVRSGLSLAATATVTGNRSASVTRFGDEVMTEQMTETARQETALAFDADGLRVEGAATGTAIRLLIPEAFPMPVSASIASAAGRMVLPVLASPNVAVPVEYDVSLTGLAVDESVWSLLDPAQYLPRDPLDLTIDLGADLRPLIDTLDVEAIIAAVNTGVPPVELDSLRIDALRLAAVGAEVAGSGAFRLDFADTSTFPGFPRPEGSASLTVRGANRLIDTLIEMGLLAEQDALAPRMGLGMFTRPVGDDELESVLEVTPDGQVFVNQQRMR